MTDHTTFLSRRQATGADILGDRYGAACDLVTGLMETAVDEVIICLCRDFNLTQIQAHIIWDEILAWLTDPDRIADEVDDRAVKVCLIPSMTHYII
jgi:hypothetical protein